MHEVILKRFERPDEIRTFVVAGLINRDGNGPNMWADRPERRVAQWNMSASSSQDVRLQLWMTDG
jgi:hypothetical protein